MERLNQAAFDQQALEFNNTLGENQSAHNRARRSNNEETLRVNKILIQQKKDRDINQHKDWENAEKVEVEFTNNTDFMTENPQTEVSMLGDHRVKPYHFKGFNQGQIDQVNLERQMQLREQQLMKDQKVDEDKMYAMQ